jgi:hypothetical protein
MAKEMLDILANKKEVEQISELETVDDVVEFFEKKGIDAKPKDIETLKAAFKTAAEKGSDAIDEKKLASIGGGSNLSKAGIVAGVIGATIGGAFFADKYLNDGKCVRDVGTRVDSARTQVNTWFGNLIKKA